MKSILSAAIRRPADYDGGRGAAPQAARGAGAPADLDDLRASSRRPRVEARHVSGPLASRPTRASAARRGLDVPGAHDGHRIQCRQVPDVRASAGSGDGVADVDRAVQIGLLSTWSLARVRMVRPASAGGRFARTGITTRSTAGNPPRRPTTGITSRACIPPPASSGSTSTTTTAGRSRRRRSRTSGARGHQGDLRSGDAAHDRAQRVCAEAPAQPSVSRGAHRPLHAPGRDDRQRSASAEMSRSIASTSRFPRSRRSRPRRLFARLEPQPFSAPATPGLAPPGPSSGLRSEPHTASDSGLDERHARTAGSARQKQVGELIARGDFAAVWVPAFQAKDIAIALEPHLAHLAPLGAMPASPPSRASCAPPGSSMPPATSAIAPRSKPCTRRSSRR